jgi:KipI family sensor histidine kinase inhibitor
MPPRRFEVRDVDVRLVGDAAVLAVVGDRIDLPIVERVWALQSKLERSDTTGMLDIIPAYASLLVRFDPLAIDAARVMAAVRGAAESDYHKVPRRGRRWTIGVCFGGEHGVDFEHLAHELGMREARLRGEVCKPDYRVAFLGFLAGFPYLLGLPPALRVRRHSTPRPRVPAGTIAIAGGQCGIYPRQSPGGWQLLGRTMVPMFDPMRESPALLAPGDAVRFQARETFAATADADLEMLA